MGIKSATILAVDDNPRITESLKLILSDYEVISVSSGEEALRLLSQPNVVDLVLLDIKMGGIDGIQVLEKIKARFPDVGVIMVTVLGEKSNLLMALRGHADDFIEKPLKHTEVLRAVEDYLQKKFLEQKTDDSSPVTRVLRLLERNVDRDVTLEDASRIAALSPKYLSRVFKKETGKNFLEYKLDLKLREAERLLTKSRLDVNNIAYRLGYENSESFMKIFKKSTGLTPTQFRSQP